MATSEMITEQLLAVDYDNAAIDDADLQDPNWQLFDTDTDYRIRYTANVLAAARRIKAELQTYKRVEGVLTAYQGNGWHAQADSPDPMLGDEPF